MKANVNVDEILILLIDILTLGHGDGAYTQYFMVGDSNYTILSFCHVLRALRKSW